MVIGLAMSNETVSNACFMVCHLLHRCTCCALVNPTFCAY